MADQVQEACHKTKTLIGRYFEQQQTDLVSQLVGQQYGDYQHVISLYVTSTTNYNVHMK